MTTTAAAAPATATDSRSDVAQKCLVRAAALASTLPEREYSWTLLRGRADPDEPNWGFAIFAADDGLDDDEADPLVVAEAHCACHAVALAIAMLEKSKGRVS